eukprot:363291-Chlamydomonas_euryale.AAC.23
MPELKLELHKLTAAAKEQHESRKAQLMLFAGGDCLGQVTWLVNVVATQQRQVVAQQLHWDDVDDWLQRVHSLRHLDDAAALICIRHHALVARVAHDTEAGSTCKQLLDHAVHLLVHRVLGRKQDDWQLLIHQRQWPVLHLASEDAFAVDESDLHSTHIPMKHRPNIDKLRHTA